MIGNDFVKGTFTQSVITNIAVQFFIKEKFNVKDFTSNSMGDGNVLNRIFNNIVEGINSQILFPKVIVIVLNSDIAKICIGKVKRGPNISNLYLEVNLWLGVNPPRG